MMWKTKRLHQEVVEVDSTGKSGNYMANGSTIPTYALPVLSDQWKTDTHSQTL